MRVHVLVASKGTPLNAKRQTRAFVSCCAQARLGVQRKYRCAGSAELLRPAEREVVRALASEKVAAPGLALGLSVGGSFFFRSPSQNGSVHFVFFSGCTLKSLC